MIKDRRVTLAIDNIHEESESVRTFQFKTDIPIEAGQFIMLTDFKGGEKPFSISDHGIDHLSVTVKKLGEFTSRLFSLKKGDIVSIRGAYGSSFFTPGKKSYEGRYEALTEILPEDFRPILCGGGFGLPPLYYLAKELISTGVPAGNIRVISAGRTEEDILFENRFIGEGISFRGAVEEMDGEKKGRIKGTAAAGLEEILAEEGFAPNFLYASGSDLMMKSLLPILPGNVEYQFLFERYMKCAIGICGSCVVDPSGIRICKEGPALMRHQVEQLEEFGVYRRTASGSIEYFNNRFKVPEDPSQNKGTVVNDKTVTTVSKL